MKKSVKLWGVGQGPSATQGLARHQPAVGSNCIDSWASVDRWQAVALWIFRYLDLYCYHCYFSLSFLFLFSVFVNSFYLNSWVLFPIVSPIPFFVRGAWGRGVSEWLCGAYLLVKKSTTSSQLEYTVKSNHYISGSSQGANLIVINSPCMWYFVARILEMKMKFLLWKFYWSNRCPSYEFSKMKWWVS